MNSAPQTLAIDIGDVELPYLYYHGRGRPVVMLHTTGFLPWLWHPIAGALAGDYRLTAPYFCDYRESDPRKYPARPSLSKAQSASTGI